MAVPVQCERAFTTTEESYYSLLRRFSVLLESSLSPVLLHIDVVVIANSVRGFLYFFLELILAYLASVLQITLIWRLMLFLYHSCYALILVLTPIFFK